MPLTLAFTSTLPTFGGVSTSQVVLEAHPSTSAGSPRRRSWSRRQRSRSPLRSRACRRESTRCPGSDR
jgi:hypothetical protein